MGKSKGLEYLLSAGAETGLVDIWGYPPIFTTLQNNHQECLRILLQHDPNVPILTDIGGRSALHVAALYSNPETLDIFAEFGSGHFEIEALDKTGMTPRDLFGQREDTSSEHRNVFERLIAKIYACEIHQSAPQLSKAKDEYDDDEEINENDFVDAVENINDLNGLGRA